MLSGEEPDEDLARLAAQLGRLKGLAERQKKKEAALLREALDDLLRKHERS